MSRRVRVASVGLGWWGSTLADRAEAAGLDLVSCFARSTDSRVEFAEARGCRSAATWDELLSDPDVEGVLIATPHSTHADLVCEAASAGKHVFVDKPFTLKVADAARATRACDDAGVVLQVGHNRRRQPATRWIKSMVDAGELGMPHYAEANLSYPKGLNPRSGWRGDPAESPAGGMAGLGVHMADNLVYLFGQPARISAFSRKIIGVGPLDDATTAIVEFPDGPLAVLATTMVIPDIARTAVFGTEAAAWNEVDGEKAYVQRVGEKERSEVPVETLDTILDELAEFGRCVANGETPEVGGWEALEVVAIFEGLVESAATGRAVDLAEVRSRR
ncbi:MAG: Gfo/Idh/MocA family oxidoreductase [Acidimicrobiia bacterium]|nr:Gfo/Idh/MocA family oxidoreductase [Acidimicrobiia bacterium]MDH4308798.1 Gfo/Idh/MocA family oxidoreductase [Acidimicrobiia bacterium]MDH5294053.1 Gfo/Idh/MocA family oxidoreductase [Acidimicrobiia bacterium]